MVRATGQCVSVMCVYARVSDEAIYYYVTLQAYYRSYNGREHLQSLHLLPSANYDGPSFRESRLIDERDEISSIYSLVIRRKKLNENRVRCCIIFVFANFQTVVHGRRRISAFSGSETFERSNAIIHLGDKYIFRRIERFRRNSIKLENDKFVFGTGALVIQQFLQLTSQPSVYRDKFACITHAMFPIPNL